MDKIRYGKWVDWIPVIVILRLMVSSTAQQGFLSLDCGGLENHTGPNGIKWVPDAKYIDVGERAYIGDASQEAYGSYLHNLRKFPKPRRKSCYQLPVLPNVHYLLRLWFAVGNDSGFEQLPTFNISIETPGMLFRGHVPIEHREWVYYYDFILDVSSSSVLYICLIRTSEIYDPFINAIELRHLQDGMYRQAQPGTMLRSYMRIDVGGNSLLRYPNDAFDRIWTTYDKNLPPGVQFVSTQEQISTKNVENPPPLAVMQTGWATNMQYFMFPPVSVYGNKSLLLLYFAELETLNMSESRSFYVDINGERATQAITLVQDYSALELAFLSNKTINFTFDLVKAANSTRGTIINALEYYSIIETDRATNPQDIKALAAIRSTYGIKGWIADPCYLIEWEGIGCHRSSSAVRISEINLSGRNLTGSVPDDILMLNALVNLSLDNNHLNGHFPNLSGLTVLERLDLQNNNMSGSIPDWLPQLKNLKELFIQNNHFSGVIPAQLLDRPSLKFNYSGNPNLCVHEGHCNLPNSNKKKVMVVLGIPLIGIVIIVLALIVAMVVYRRKFKRKVGVPWESRQAEQGPLQREYHDYSMIMMSNPTRCRVFSLDEMMAATQNFSTKIGQGGFGSVFFGKLPVGKDVAIKVLSSSSKQGVHEFKNEVELLSKVHHRNLVLLLGYCNESRELMLIYEHMSGGSLRDHLYDSSPRSSELKWKARVKIALDAAQGLEYLHVGCTPKIIHRDVKTSNILLDGNMKGKLADFGLSKMTIDGEATHVTTVVKGTAGYIDPEYFNTQILSEKSDVYSFGVVLLEIICGRQPVDIKLPVKEVNLLRWATPYVENDEKIAEIIDKRLGGTDDMESISRVAKLAIRCAQAEPSSRPSASEVVAELKEAMNPEYNSSLSILEEITESRISLAGPVYASVDSGESKGMEWSDNSSNLSKVGR